MLGQKIQDTLCGTKVLHRDHYAAIAANEAEKAAHVNVLEVRAFGSFGRVYLGGEERDIDVGYRVAEQAIREITGRQARV